MDRRFKVVIVIGIFTRQYFSHCKNKRMYEPGRRAVKQPGSARADRLATAGPRDGRSVTVRGAISRAAQNALERRRHFSQTHDVA
ncbi:hypothetical protein [uncultured Methylobacterium sp.]|uniref:hypothetical protein n=1 Tax=uncultured Methylobacterium sp. TaxID=157278 RepID=UPI002596DBC1|nr:hypothetical protein [uncultured Methylobacterium sp.]